MVENIELDLNSIMRTFEVECDERITEMEQAILALESNPENEALLERIFRNAHTIKGNAASLGIVAVAEFSHAIENLLQRLRGGAASVNREVVTLLLRSADALREMLPSCIAGSQSMSAENTALVKYLAQGNMGEDQAQFKTEGESTVKSLLGDAALATDDAVITDRNGTIRVDIRKLDRMLNLAGEINIAQGRLRQALEMGLARGEKVRNEAFEIREQLERLSLDLQDEIMKVRMVPVGPIFRQQIRVVRDVAVANGKQARLVTEGEEVEIDLSVIEHLKDPLTHMIRNSIDHGIEAPETRLAQGKDPCGLLTLKAFHDGGNIVIQLIDDGAGLNRERILAIAREQRLVDKGEKPSDQEIFQFIFRPGFSTAPAVTNLSGRGVGMDVVKREIEAARGSIGLDSEAGKGTVVTIRLPLTLAIIEGFGVGVGDDTYILPLHTVRECLPFAGEGQSSNNSQGLINLRGEPLPYIRLSRRFDVDPAQSARESIVVVECDGIKAGLAVDALYGRRQTVIKPMGKPLFHTPCIAGSAILDNGRVALILDIPRLLREATRMSGQTGGVGAA